MNIRELVEEYKELLRIQDKHYNIFYILQDKVQKDTLLLNETKAEISDRVSLIKELDARLAELKRELIDKKYDNVDLLWDN